MPLAACLCSPLKGACPRRGDHETNSHASTSFISRQRTRNWSFFAGAASASASARPLNNKGGFFPPRASWIATSQIVTSVFGVGTAAVLPFYALMVFAPKTNLTKKTSESSFPYVALGLVYAYLLYLSWTPDSVKLIFSGQYLLPEISGITKLFSSEMTLASAWIHLLVVDLFAARQIFHDGLENRVETRHSVSLCLFCCPLGIFTHFITKALTGPAANTTP